MQNPNNVNPNFYNNTDDNYNPSNLAVNPQGTYGQPHLAMQNTAKTASSFTADIETFKKYALIAVIYAFFYVFFLYENKAGITYPLYMTCTLILIAWARKKDGLSIFKSKNGKIGLNIFYIISLMLLSVSKCMTMQPDILWLDGFAINLLMFSFLIHMYVDTRGWDIVGWFIGILLTMLTPIIHFLDPVNDFAGWVKSRGNKINSEKKATILAVIAGLAVALPILAIVVPLLASADAVFSSKVGNMFKFIFEFDYILDLFWITMSAIWATWLFYTVIKVLAKNGMELNVSKKEGINPAAGITVTGLLCIVYLFFSGIQIFGLFMGKMTLPKDYTYAEYAHEGFYQLLAVSIMNLVLVTLCQRLFRDNTILKVLLIIVGMCTYIMIASSAFRMIMYIGAYHLTFLRVFVLWFLVVISLWLAYLLISLIYDSFPVFNCCMVTVTVMYIAFVFANPDYQIARYDLQYLDSETTSADYYSSSSMEYYLTNELSMDAVPAFEGNNDILYEYGNDRYDYDNNKYKKITFNTIRTFNFSEYRAHKLIEKVYNQK